MVRDLPSGVVVFVFFHFGRFLHRGATTLYWSRPCAAEENATGRNLSRLFTMCGKDAVPAGMELVLEKVLNSGSDASEDLCSCVGWQGGSFIT